MNITYFCHENIHKFTNLLVLSHFRAWFIHSPRSISASSVCYIFDTLRILVFCFDKRTEISVICISSIYSCFYPFRNYIKLKMQQYLRCPFSQPALFSYFGCFSSQHENNLCNTKKTTCRMRRCDKKCTL